MLLTPMYVQQLVSRPKTVHVDLHTNKHFHSHKQCILLQVHNVLLVLQPTHNFHGWDPELLGNVHEHMMEVLRESVEALI